MAFSSIPTSKASQSIFLLPHTIAWVIIKVNADTPGNVVRIFADYTPYFIFSISCFNHSNSRWV